MATRRMTYWEWWERFTVEAFRRAPLGPHMVKYQGLRREDILHDGIRIGIQIGTRIAKEQPMHRLLAYCPDCGATAKLEQQGDTYVVTSPQPEHGPRCKDKNR